MIEIGPHLTVAIVFTGCVVVVSVATYVLGRK